MRCGPRSSRTRSSPSVRSSSRPLMRRTSGHANFYESRDSMPNVDELFAAYLNMYRAVIVRWIDADTVVLDIDQGFHSWKHNQRIRIVGIDAPDKQPAKGKATEWAANAYPLGTSCYVKTYV